MWGESYLSPYGPRRLERRARRAASMWGESYLSPYADYLDATTRRLLLQCGGRVTSPRIPQPPMASNTTTALQCGGRVTSPRMADMIGVSAKVDKLQCGGRVTSPRMPGRQAGGCGAGGFNVGGELPLPVCGR